VPEARADRNQYCQTPHAGARADADAMTVGRVSAAPIARSPRGSGVRTTPRSPSIGRGEQIT